MAFERDERIKYFSELEVGEIFYLVALYDEVNNFITTYTNILIKKSDIGFSLLNCAERGHMRPTKFVIRSKDWMGE